MADAPEARTKATTFALSDKFNAEVGNAWYTAGGVPMNQVIGDFNGDGWQDVTAAFADWPTGTVLTNLNIWLNAGNSDWRYLRNELTKTHDLSFPSKVFVDDFNGDGRDDIYIATLGNELDQSGDLDRLWLADEHYRYTLTVQPDFRPYYAHGTSSGDFNGDGAPDIIEGGIGNYPTSILLNDGHGIFTRMPDGFPGLLGTPDRQAPEAAATRVADLNGDGLDDLIVGHDGGTAFPATGGRSVEIGFRGTVYYSNGDATFQQPIELTAGKIPYWNTETVAITTFDANNDGLVDILFSNVSEGNFLTSDGKFYNHWELPQKYLSDPAYVAGLEVHEMQLLINHGGGHWVDETSRIEHPTGPTGGKNFPEAFVQDWSIVDFNNDGALDIFASLPAEIGKAGPQAWLNDGSGHFHLVKLPAVDDFWAPSLVDGDNDGDWDIFATRVVDFIPDSARQPITLQFLENLTPHTGNFGGSNLRDRLHGDGGDNTIWGFDRDDRLWGGRGDDKLLGGTGADRLSGGPGQDQLRGGPGDDTLIGNAGNDVLLGQAGDDLLAGNAGADRLLGGPGDDQLSGGAGADVLAGGPGLDILTGGPGGDRFVIGAAEDRIDRITDFAAGDRLDLGAVFEHGVLGPAPGGSQLDDSLQFSSDGRDTTLAIDRHGTASFGAADIRVVLQGTDLVAGAPDQAAVIDQLLAGGQLEVT